MPSEAVSGKSAWSSGWLFGVHPMFHWCLQQRTPGNGIDRSRRASSRGWKRTHGVKIAAKERLLHCGFKHRVQYRKSTRQASTPCERHGLGEMTDCRSSSGTLFARHQLTVVAPDHAARVRISLIALRSTSSSLFVVRQDVRLFSDLLSQKSAIGRLRNFSIPP